MGISTSLEPVLSSLSRRIRIANCIFPALSGLFMVLWGIFFNTGDWILIGAGLIIFLAFGRGMYHALAGE